MQMNKNNIQIGTSDSHPLIVNFVPQEEIVSLKGTLGLSFAPGKWHYGVKSGIQWQRDLEKDLIRLRDDCGITNIVTLLEKWEFCELKIPNLRSKIFELQMNSIWFPIKDGGVPDLGDETLAKFDVFISYLELLLKNGENLVLHCMGGLGRAGTIASCILIKTGKSPRESIGIVREARKGAVETLVQEKFCENYGNYLNRLNLEK